MGQKQASYDSTGKIVAFYDTVDSPAPTGATVLDITEAQWQTCISQQGWTVAHGALVAPPPDPAPTAAQVLAGQAAALLSGPVTITSTSTPALDGSYTITAQDQQHIAVEVQSLMLNGTFADGAASVQWPDATGALHTFDAAQFKAFATAVGAVVAACIKCSIGTSTTLPSAAVTIA